MNPCRRCQRPFTITDEDRAFYAKVDVPEPSHCPPCRQFRRLAQVSQIHLFKRKCDATGKVMISNYPEGSPCPVYSQEHWHSDAFDGTQYGRDFDFNRPFFEQFEELSREVPRPALLRNHEQDINSDYTNYAGMDKNCYLIFDSDENEDCLYSYGMNGSRSSADCYRVQNMELSYECVDSQSCYNCAYVFNSLNCVDSAFLNNCTSCRNCLFSSNLHQKEYHVFNKRVSKEEFEQIKASLSSYETLMKYVKQFEEFKLKFPQKFMRGFQNENTTGNHVVNSKNALDCYDSMKIWDGKYCTQVFMGAKDLMDVDEVGVSELVYDSNNSGLNAYNLRFTHHCLNQLTNLTYSAYCFSGCSNLFGCIGLKRKQYCILNKQYTQGDYEALVPRIIEHMKKTGEWGEFFPAQSTPFYYNLTMAHEWFPLSKEQALAQGFRWKDEEARDYQPATCTLPDRIEEVPDSICQELLACVGCSRNYRIVPQELKLYRRMGMPLPRHCFHCRHDRRFRGRTPRHLWDRQCAKCSTAIRTAYAPERPEIVYCGECYLEEMY